jgi:hypothetical protein
MSLLFTPDQRTAHTHTRNQDLNYICGHILPTITFYHNDILLYYILFISSIIHNFSC